MLAEKMYRPADPELVERRLWA
ncbi:maltose acetyltransferase domain-containing protein [Microbulbifer sp. YPW1]|nr:hypothetical protein HUW35_08065 [Microbulbifer sp. YPW1]